MVAVTLEGTARRAAEVGLRIALIVAVAVFLRVLTRRGIDRAIVRAKARLVSRRGSARLDTVSSMLGSLATVVLVSLSTLLVLGELRINLGPLLAGAGVAGIAVGFGAQSVVRDVLAGFFVMMEDQYGVGDEIDVGPAVGIVVGTVERMSLRSTQLRDVNGTIWHVPNGTIALVGNRSQHWSRAVVDLVVAHTADLRLARATMFEVADSMSREPEWVSAMRVGGEVEDQGISALSPSGVSLRLVVSTEPASKLSVERELRMRIKEAFDRAAIPFEVHQPQRPLP